MVFTLFGGSFDALQEDAAFEPEAPSSYSGNRYSCFLVPAGEIGFWCSSVKSPEVFMSENPIISLSR
ncbi:hypothetical protein CEXT_625081 [Caerostris extrusa]|uniref:Uncharacterized protein n=1 Tax=Caerostris extrusa TaxID=172846 RepID=A0AAV4M3U9_CAEEX|nr:hypothetical protein CEXT_625081 [Caerostris extrusa]